MGFSYALGKLSLDDLVADAQANPVDDTKEMAEILRRFEGAVWKIARTYASDGDLLHDAAQAARLGLVKAVRAHSLGTAGFTTYALRYMKGNALRTIKRLRTQEITVDPTEFAWPDRQYDMSPDTVLELVDLMEVLTPEQQKLAKAHYIADVSLSDIGAELTITKSAVTQRFAVINRNLRTAFEGALAA